MAGRQRWWALTAVSLATLMTYLDNNVINVALPTIQHSLGVSVSGLEWIVSSYLLVLGGLLLVGGRIADVFGRRRMFFVGLVIFTFSSLAAGLAGSGGVLIAARSVQGLGGALLMPTTLAIIAATFTSTKERTAAIGIWGAVGALGLALGPVIGGLVSQHFHWGWIFLINVPIGVVTAAIAIPSISESHGRTGAGARLDIPGLISSAVALFALTYALIEGSDKGWTSSLIVASFAVAAVAAGVFLAIEARSEQPMVPLPIFRSAAFSGGLGTMMIWSFGVLGIYFFTSLYLQRILGFSPTKAGLAFVPMALCLAVAAILSARVTAMLGAHRTVALGMAVMAVGLLLFVRIGASATFGALLPGFVLFGLGAGLMNVPLTNTIVEGAPATQSGIASALLNASREVASVLGITVVGAVLSSSENSALRSGTQPAQAFVDGYHAGLWLTIGLMVAGVVVSYVTLRPRRQPADLAATDLAAIDLASAELGLSGPPVVREAPVVHKGTVLREANAAREADVPAEG
ncbi:MAG TPA: MFS transporter [Trebonia sp.]|jgi:EmrB/QacA subfamily drug resistance transporter